MSYLLEQIREEVSGREEYRELEGEWNLLMAHVFLYPDQAIPYLQKAREMIDGHSRPALRHRIFDGCVRTSVHFLKETRNGRRSGEKSYGYDGAL